MVYDWFLNGILLGFKMVYEWFMFSIRLDVFGKWIACYIYIYMYHLISS